MKISVVIASYNHAPYVGACIESAIAQTLRPSEVIVVDDGSTDESRGVIESFGSRIRAVCQANRGTSAALNAGFALATGDWIAIHNSDDVWAPNKLERQAAAVREAAEVGLCHTGWSCIDEHGEPCGLAPEYLNLPDFHGPPVADMLAEMLRSMPVVISSAMISRTAWQACGSFDERFHGLGDWDMCLRVSRQFAFAFVDAPLTLVRRHAGNASTDATRIPAGWTRHDWSILAHETLWEAAEDMFRRGRDGRTPAREAAFAMACLGTAYSCARQPDLARAAYLLSARLQPRRARTYLRYLVTFLPRAIRRRIR